MFLFFGGGDGLGWMEENKKSGGGDVRAKALSWDGEWDKAKNKFSALSPLSPTVGCCAPHSHPSPPEEKAASRKKSRLRRKKSRLQHTGQYRVRRQVCELPFWVFSASILWRRWVGTDFSALFGFGPKRGSFVVQKRNETPETPETPETLETLCVVVRIAFL